MKDLKIFTNNIEDSAKAQIDLLLEQEAFKDCKVRIMPDVHAGAGCVIGFTGNLGDKVIPNIVGVDIGCGMLCANLGNVDLDLEKLEQLIKYVKEGKMKVQSISLEPHLQPRYLTDDLQETIRKDKLEYYEYTIVIRENK